MFLFHHSHAFSASHISETTKPNEPCLEKIYHLLMRTKVQLSLFMRKPFFAYAKTKTQISFTVTTKLISAFVFATRIVQFLYFLSVKFQASSHLQQLHSPVCVRPGRKPRRPVYSQRGSIQLHYIFFLQNSITSSF